MDRTLVILAAGLGSRYGGLKQLDTVGPSGECVMDYAVYDALQTGFNKVVFVIRRDIETAFRETVGKRFEPHIDTRYAFQESTAVPAGFSVPAERHKPWGTGHAVLAAEPFVAEPFAVINADDFYGRQGFEHLAEHLAAPLPPSETTVCALVGFTLANTLSPHGTVSRGVCTCDQAGRLTSISEKKNIAREGDRIVARRDDDVIEELAEDTCVSMNMWGFPPAMLEHLHVGFARFLENHGTDNGAEFFLPDVMDDLIERGLARTRVYRSTDVWMGVTYREDKPQVTSGIQQLVSNGVYPSPLFADDGNG